MSFWELWYFIPYRFFFMEVCIRWLILLQSTLGTYGKRHRKIRYFLNSVKEKKIITIKVTFYFGLWLFYIIKWLWIWGTFALVLIYHIFLFAGIGKHTKKNLGSNYKWRTSMSSKSNVQDLHCEWKKNASSILQQILQNQTIVKKVSNKKYTMVLIQ